MKKGKEIMSLSKSELGSRLGELKKELMKLRAQSAAGAAPKKSSSIKEARKNMARIMTAMGRK